MRVLGGRVCWGGAVQWSVVCTPTSSLCLVAVSLSSGSTEPVDT